MAGQFQELEQMTAWVQRSSIIDTEVTKKLKDYPAMEKALLHRR